MVYEYMGVVHEVQSTINPDTFAKRNIIIKHTDDYGDTFATFTAFKDKTATLEEYQAGERVKVRFVVRGAKQGWSGTDKNGNPTTKYFTDLAVVSIERVGGVAEAPAHAASRPVAQAAQPAAQRIQGATMQAAIAEWTAWKGEDKAGFASFCQGLIKLPDGNPKPSKSYTVADWGTIVNAIRDAVAKTVAGGAASPSMAPDEMPW